MKLFGILFCLTISFFLLNSLAFAQEPTPSIIVSLPVTVSPIPPQPTINYSFPYPGILPDNPLYFLKAIRDNIIDWLIADPLKKAEFDLLQSDKRLESGVYLVQENPSKSILAIQTMSKGENYMNNAISNVQLAKRQGLPVKDFIHKLHTATQAHVQTIRGLSPMIPSSDKPGLNLLLQRAENLQQSAAQLAEETK